MKRNIFISLSIVFVLLGIVVYLMGYFFFEDDNQPQDIGFSVLMPNFPPGVSVNDFLQGYPDATQFRMDGEEKIDISSPSLSLDRGFSDPYFASCSYNFLKGKLNDFYCISDINEKNLDQNRYFLNAIKAWGRPDHWVVISVLNTFGPAMVWEDSSSLRVVRGVFEDYNPKALAVSITYQKDRKLSYLGSFPNNNDTYEKKLEGVRDSLLSLLEKDDQ